MMAKNVEQYIPEAIESVLALGSGDWELIIVDDHSEDKTKEVASSYRDRSGGRITVVSNPYVGKVSGTNYAFSLSSGDYIKCIDSDDILGDFLSEHSRLAPYDVMMHRSTIVSNDLTPLVSYDPPKIWLSGTYEDVVSNLVSCPKFTWSFSRKIATIVFPMPNDLPFEDVWMSVILKQNAKSIKKSNASLYLYRQHEGQTYGGIANFGRKVTEFRAKRLLKLTAVLRGTPRVMAKLNQHVFDRVDITNRYLGGEAHIHEFLASRPPVRTIAKTLCIRHAPTAASWFAKLLWQLRSARKAAKAKR